MDFRKHAIAAVVAIAAAPALAQTPEGIAQYKDWGVYVASTGSSKVCFALSKPRETKPEGVKRGDIYVFVTSRPGENVTNEVTIEIGYPFKEGGRAQAKIGDASFSLYTKGEKAWVENAAEEPGMVAAMRAGADMVVTGTSQRGTNTTDTYSLQGITDALNRVASECK
ncbi:MAG: invasion associated locus B family protein [Flavobacteriaceae bacterium]